MPVPGDDRRAGGARIVPSRWGWAVRGEHSGGIPAGSGGAGSRVGPDPGGQESRRDAGSARARWDRAIPARKPSAPPQGSGLRVDAANAGFISVASRLCARWIPAAPPCEDQWADGLGRVAIPR